jgi:REP element-mobilizing transposase RayT
MSRYRRAIAAGSSYFFTVVAYRRQSILCDEAIRNALCHLNRNGTCGATFRHRCMGIVT